MLKNKSQKNPLDFKDIYKNNNNSKKLENNSNVIKEDKKEKEQIILFKNNNNNNNYNNKQLNEQINNNKIKKEEEKQNINEELNSIKNNIANKNTFIYEIILKMINDETNEELFTKMITVDKSDNYLLNLDYVFSIATSFLNKKKIEYKFGLSYKLGYLYLEEKVGSINLLNYDILSEVIKDDENIIKKRLILEINIIKNNFLEGEKNGLNPQLFCKLTKNYNITPNINIINTYNLFSYDKGIKIDMKYISIIFNKDEIYDLTFVNFDELSYNEDTEIFFDNKNFEKENSTLLKLSEKEITLIYKGINFLYGEKSKEKVIDYLNKRYQGKKCEYDLNEANVVMITKIKNLLISEEQSKFFYDEFKKNIL